MIVAVDGNIGSGKSTVLAKLRATHDVFLEPVDSWTLLDKFYEDKRKYALAFNLEVLAGFSDLESPASGGVVVSERSPLTARDVFARIMVNEGAMTDVEWDLYKRYHDLIGWEPDAIVYIDTPVATCHERMRRRGRACETTVEIEYLERVERAYDTLLRFTKVPVVRVDGLSDEDEIHRRVHDAIESLNPRVTSPLF